MLYWMERKRGGPDTLDGFGTVSKAEILRSIVTEKLSTAAQEILAVVERTVAGYEEEASGFRREIARQRRQLDVLLQPRVKLERRDVEDHEVVLVSEEEEEGQQHAQHAGEEEEDMGSLGLLCFDDDDEEGDGGEEERLSVQQALSSRQNQEDLNDPDYQLKPSSRSDRKRPGRPCLSDSRNHIDLRICFLDDSETDVLSKSVGQKCQMQELRCPRGLQEANFLDLLRSTFPQLAPQKPFRIFTSDRLRKLLPLRVKMLTAEEILSSLRQNGAGHSALYIRLKGEEDPPSSSDELHPLHRPDGSPASSTATSTERSQSPSRLMSPSDLSERRRRGRPRRGEEPTHYGFKVCVLEGSPSDVLSKNVFLRSSIQELLCPRAMQEADFVSLLRSSFPQLAGDNRSVELFRSDRSRRLQRLPLTAVTPEEICRSMKGNRVDKTFLYVRLKTGEEDEEEEECHLSQRTTAEPLQSEAEVSSSSSVHREEGRRADAPSSSTQDVDPKEAEDEDGAESGDDSDEDWKPERKSRSLKVRRKQGAPGLEGKWTEGSKVCRVCWVWYRLQGSLIKHAWCHVDEPQHVCGVCGEHFESEEELKGHLRGYQKTHDCSYCGKSFLSVTGLSAHTSLHTGDRPYKCDVCDKSYAYMSGLSIHRWAHVSDKPHKCDICPKAFGLKAQLVAHRKAHTGRDRYVCNICGKAVHDLRSLTRHRATHSGERRYGCQVCGKRFKLSNTLKAHEKIHTVRERPYLCHICCKTFMSGGSLTAHMKTHSDDRPFTCAICNKGFVSNGELNAHMRVHTDEAPYGCSECGRFFKRKTHLNNHVRSHLGIKLFVCPVCGKACARQEHLTVHMRTHNGERPYQCSLCDKAFTQSHCLKTHMKSHSPSLNAHHV